jgi:excisionase family DNA binding protein
VSTRKSTSDVPRLLLSIPEAAKALGCSVWAVRSLIWDQKLPFLKIGKRFLIDIADIRVFIANASHASSDDARREIQAYRESLSNQDPRVAAPLIVAKANEILTRYERSKSGHGGVYRDKGGRF